MSTLDGRVVVVTGAARGLGAELARRLDARSARLALLGLEPEVLADVAAGCRDALAVPVDVTDGEALSAAADQVRARFGRVDVVVANAGVAAGGPLLLADPVAYDRVIEVNLLGSVRTVRAFLPDVVATRGYVLQVASLAAMAPAPLMGAYCASKSGVEAFAHSLRGEVRHHGVDVGVAYLSWTDTDMVRGADEHDGLRTMRQRMPGPLGRTCPVGPAVERLVEGIERRSAHVYGQGWLRGVQLVRPFLPALLARAPKAGMRRTEQAVRSEGSTATGAVGAGGQADTCR